MPFDGSGNFNRVMNWVNDAVANIKIKADRHDQEDDNFAAGLSNTLTKDGQSQPTANIPMNGKRIVNLANPTSPQDAATLSSAQAIRNFSTGISLTGPSTGSSPAFVSAAFVGFTEADMSVVARKADPAASPAQLDRIVINSKADGTGTDLLVVRDDGTVVGTQGSLFKRTVWTVNGNHTYDKDTKYLLIEVQGGGGAGGGNVSGTTGTCGSGGGGGGGGYTSKFYARPPGPSGNIVIGAGGSGGGSHGGAGGDSRWQDALSLQIIGVGGGGGISTGAVSTTSCGTGGGPGSGSGGDVVFAGGFGHAGISLGSSFAAGTGVARLSQSGNGGSSHLGGGGRGGTAVASAATAVTGAGNAGTNFGGGGGGGGAINTNGTGAGGDGAPGCIIVWEFR